jgi:RNA polymerase-binding transcription factor
MGIERRGASSKKPLTGIKRPRSKTVALRQSSEHGKGALRSQSPETGQRGKKAGKAASRDNSVKQKAALREKPSTSTTAPGSAAAKSAKTHRANNEVKRNGRSAMQGAQKKASPNSSGHSTVKESLLNARQLMTAKDPRYVTKAAVNAAGDNSIQKKKIMGKKPSLTNLPSELPSDYRPSDSETFMGSLQRIYFRKKLIHWKNDILHQNRETLQVLHDDTLQHADVADRATSEADRALELRSRDRLRKLIAKIDAAIARLDDGSYGYCEVTGEPISLKRLDARPIATMTLEQQERHERREKVYRDE